MQTKMKPIDNLVASIMQAIRDSTHKFSDHNEAHNQNMIRQALQDYVREECRAVLSQREALVDIMAADAKDGLYGFDGKETWDNTKFEVKVEEPKQKPIVRCWEESRGWYTMDADDFRRNNPGWFGFTCEYESTAPPPKTESVAEKIKRLEDEVSKLSGLDQYKGMKTRQTVESALKAAKRAAALVKAPENKAAYSKVCWYLNWILGNPQ